MGMGSFGYLPEEESVFTSRGGSFKSESRWCWGSEESDVLIEETWILGLLCKCGRKKELRVHSFLTVGARI